MNQQELCSMAEQQNFQHPNYLRRVLESTALVEKLGQKMKITTHGVCITCQFVHCFFRSFSFDDVDPKRLAITALFLAAKAQNEYRQLEFVIKTGYVYIHPRFQALDVKSVLYEEVKEEIILLENVLLKVLGFDVDVELPHPHVIKMCLEMNGSHQLSKKSFYLATASFMVSTFCLQYKPVTVACVCFNLGAKWTQTQITKEDPLWFSEYDKTLTAERLMDLTNELGDAIKRAASLVNSPVLEICVQAEKHLTSKAANVKENSKKGAKKPTLTPVLKRTSFSDKKNEMQNSPDLNNCVKSIEDENPLNSKEAYVKEDSKKDEKQPTLTPGSKRSSFSDITNDMQITSLPTGVASKTAEQVQNPVPKRVKYGDIKEIKVKIPLNMIKMKDCYFPY